MREQWEGEEEEERGWKKGGVQERGGEKEIHVRNMLLILISHTHSHTHTHTHTHR